MAENPTDARDEGMSRRGFLIAGGALFGAALVLGPNGIPRSGALTRLARSGGPRLSVGYVEGSAGLDPVAARALLSSSGTRVVPAASLRTTPRPLTNGLVKMRVGGLTPGVDTSTGAQLDALVAPPRGAGDQPLPFYAWTMSPGGTAGGSQFTAPVVSEPTLGFALRRSNGTGEPAESVAVFTGGRDRDLPKLHPGLYLLGFTAGAWSSTRVLGGEFDPAWGHLGSLAVSVHPAA